jgi:hypothetical protein
MLEVDFNRFQGKASSYGPNTCRIRRLGAPDPVDLLNELECSGVSCIDAHEHFKWAGRPTVTEPFIPLLAFGGK